LGADGAAKLESLYAAGAIVSYNRAARLVDVDAARMRRRANLTRNIADLRTAGGRFSFDGPPDARELNTPGLTAREDIASRIRTTIAPE